eukprot:730547-Prymnesium_polylepis.1
MSRPNRLGSGRRLGRDRGAAVRAADVAAARFQSHGPGRRDARLRALLQQPAHADLRRPLR